MSLETEEEKQRRLHLHDVRNVLRKRRGLPVAPVRPIDDGRPQDEILRVEECIRKQIYFGSFRRRF